MCLMSVVLPASLGPTRPKTQPHGTVRLVIEGDFGAEGAGSGR